MRGGDGEITFDQVFQADLAAHYPPLSRWKYSYHFKYPILSWQRRLRRIEALERKGGTKWSPSKLYCGWLKFVHKRDSLRLGFTISPHAFGPGLSIAHWGTIAVEGKVRVGKNCRIHQGVTIGSDKGKVPTIGNNCFIGANASIIGGIELGDDVRVGAGAVVTKSFGDGAILVGVPASDRRKI